MNFTGDQIIAWTIVVGCLALLGLGIDSEVKAILAGAAAWAFGRGYGGLRR